MAKEPKIEGLFDRDGHERKVSRILDRAVQKRVREAAHGRATISEIKVPKFGAGQDLSGQKKKLGKVLAIAMSARSGRPTTGQTPAPSLRKSAPDSGGRSFHFKVYSVSKTDAPQASRGSAEAGGRLGTSSAHQRYIEREIAVEAIYEPNATEAERGAEATCVVERNRWRPSKVGLVERAEANVREGTERSTTDRFAPSRANQGYIENPTKMRSGEIGLSSFGNIARSFEERLRFWQLVEEHEPHRDARVQNRIIVELPHQSTPEARREIMQRFLEPFAQKDLPYHVAIHAPGEKNDSRNYHAHVVFSERPAKRMIHPETGEEVWDFTIAVKKRADDKWRHSRTQYPFRQNRDREFKDWKAIPKLRARFAGIVTEVMAGVDPSVKFDARSYKDMGLEDTPLATIHRVLHDRMRDGALVLMDERWTKRMVAAEIDAAAQRKDPDVERLKALTVELIRDAWPNLKAINDRLADSSRLPGLTGFTKMVFQRTANDRIRLEAEIVKERVMAKAEAEICKRVMKATAPFKEGTVTVYRATARTPEQQKELDFIHAAAAEELAATQARLKNAEAEGKRRLAANAKAFQDAGHGRTAAQPARPAIAEETHPRAPQRPMQAAPAPDPEPASKAKLATKAIETPFVPFLPQEAEAADARRKRRQGPAREEEQGQSQQPLQAESACAKAKPAVAKTAQPAAAQEQPEAGKTEPKRNPILAAARQQQAAQDNEAEIALARERLKAEIRAELMVHLKAATGAMYDQDLRGHALAAALKPEFDFYYPERNGNHAPGDGESSLMADAPARAASEAAMRADAQARGSAIAEPADARAPSEQTVARHAEAPGPTATNAPAPAAPSASTARAEVPDLSKLPPPQQPRRSGPIRIREGTHRPIFETPAAPQQTAPGRDRVAAPSTFASATATAPRHTTSGTNVVQQTNVAGDAVTAVQPAMPAPRPTPEHSFTTPASPQASTARPQPPTAPAAAPRFRVLEEGSVRGALDRTSRPIATKAPQMPAMAPAPNAEHGLPSTRGGIEEERPLMMTAPEIARHQTKSPREGDPERASAMPPQVVEEEEQASAVKREADRKRRTRRKAIVRRRPDGGLEGR